MSASRKEGKSDTQAGVTDSQTAVPGDEGEFAKATSRLIANYHERQERIHRPPIRPTPSELRTHLKATAKSLRKAEASLLSAWSAGWESVSSGFSQPAIFENGTDRLLSEDTYQSRLRRGWERYKAALAVLNQIAAHVEGAANDVKKARPGPEDDTQIRRLVLGAAAIYEEFHGKKFDMRSKGADSPVSYIDLVLRKTGEVPNPTVPYILSLIRKTRRYMNTEEYKRQVADARLRRKPPPEPNLEDLLDPMPEALASGPIPGEGPGRTELGKKTRRPIRRDRRTSGKKTSRR